MSLHRFHEDWIRKCGCCRKHRRSAARNAEARRLVRRRDRRDSKDVLADALRPEPYRKPITGWWSATEARQAIERYVDVEFNGPKRIARSDILPGTIKG